MMRMMKHDGTDEGLMKRDEKDETSPTSHEKLGHMMNMIQHDENSKNGWKLMKKMETMKNVEKVVLPSFLLPSFLPSFLLLSLLPSLLPSARFQRNVRMLHERLVWNSSTLHTIAPF